VRTLNKLNHKPKKVQQESFPKVCQYICITLLTFWSMISQSRHFFMPSFSLHKLYASIPLEGKLFRRETNLWYSLPLHVEIHRVGSWGHWKSLITNPKKFNKKALLRFAAHMYNFIDFLVYDKSIRAFFIPSFSLHKLYASIPFYLHSLSVWHDNTRPLRFQSENCDCQIYP